MGIQILYFSIGKFTWGRGWRVGVNGLLGYTGGLEGKGREVLKGFFGFIVLGFGNEDES